jgi:Uma2 family endonuclease
MVRSLPATREEDAMAPATEIARFTPEQYLALERKADLRSEYFDGVIPAIPRANRWYSLIVGNLFSKIGDQLEGRPGEVYAIDLRLCVAPIAFFTYPSVMAVVREPRFLDEESDTLLNPTMIAEVLSPTSESYLRGDKFRRYRQLPSLREYVLVARDKVLVERSIRQGDDWILTEFRNPDDTLRLTSIDCEISMREIYARIEFPREQSAAP